MTTQKAITQKNQPNKEGLEEFKRNVKEFSQKNAAKTEQARPAQAEPEQVKAENPKLDYRPPQYEVTLSTVQALVSIMTGEPCHIRPHKVVMPENDYGPITLVLSSSHNIYYRVTPSSCTCQGWYFSEKRYGIGKCRHHTLAFPDEAGENCRKLAEVKLALRQGGEVKTSPASMPEKIKAVRNALERGGIPFKSVVQDIMGEGTILVKMPYSEDLTPDQERKMERALALGREAAGAQVFVAAC